MFPIPLKASMDLSTKVAVFTDTNLGTHLVLAVSPDITAGEIGKEHHTCFPKFGEIKVNALMVKRKSYFYHLPNFVPIKNAYQGLRGTWFLHVEASPRNNFDQPCSLQGLVAEQSDSVHNGNNLTRSQKPEEHVKLDYDSVKNNSRKRKERFQQLDKSAEELPSACNTREGKNKRLKEKHRNNFKGKDEGFLGGMDSHGFSSRERLGHVGENEVDCREDEWSSWTIIEGTHSQSSSEVVSVTGIITKYFSMFDEVNQFDPPSRYGVCNDVVACEADQIYLDESLKSKTDEECTKLQVGNRLPYAAKTPSRMCLSSCGNPSPGTSRSKLGTAEVGERFVLAANNLSIAVRKNEPTISICQSKGRKTLPLISSSLVASNINSFEISDSDN
ncbi:uncharacterized protein LOC122641131 isoform X2 [Telopea speciosissima]|uniref:uncharacterized protein LOC122641131 isoform X2 n=1 Tax=Telopea speciosissima TaxID=54955 RepID=UPI001CC70FA9|nr:uncharacterized protein LOC122641131 isoform X2 [Telopea speciosissima]